MTRAIVNHWQKNRLNNNGARTFVYPSRKKTKLDSYLVSCTKINSRCIKDSPMKDKT